MYLIIEVTAFVFYGMHSFIGFVMNGARFNLFVVFALGELRMISLGLIIAARITSEEKQVGN